MTRFYQILDQIHSYYPEADTSLVEKAYIYTAKAHQGQTRLSGEPYLTHPVEVAFILSQLKLDMASIAAGLLHDTLEDTIVSREELEKEFGEDVVQIVEGVTKLTKLQFESRIKKQAENIRKMILAMSKDIRVILVKLADRLHNMRTLEHQKEEKKARIARETLEIYAPLASRLGIDWIKRELEDLSFMHLYPDQFTSLAREVNERVAKRKAYVEEVKGLIAKKLAEYGLSCQVLGRSKHLYSIFRKMRLKNVGLDEIYDLIAFRIILQTPQECYEALGIVHSLWKPIYYRFKDFIALPKANMYQSLHTTVIGPYSERMEIQIRTEEMDKVAREGIAAHWLYKEGKVVSKERQRGFDWLKSIMEWQKELEDPRQFLQSVKMDLYPDEVYVFTPKGEVKGFPKGATPIDFAYSIHSEVGHHCSGAKIHGRLVPLSYQLQNGDVVEIITSSQHVPSKDWLKLAKTSRALARIRQWIQAQEREQSLALGKELCEREFKKFRFDLNDILKERGDEIAELLSFKTPEDMLVAVGYGKISPVQVFRKATKDLIKEEIPEEREAKRPEKITGKGIQIHGIDNVMIHLARCCMPIPGDNVVGYITRGKGVTVHLENCTNIAALEPERLVEIDWTSPDHETYPVRLKVEATDKQGLLAAISSAISASGANIEKGSVNTIHKQRAEFNFRINVTNHDHLKKIMAGIRKVDGVINVHRM